MAPLELLHLATELTVSLVVACTLLASSSHSPYVHPRLKQPPSVIHGPLEVTIALDSRRIHRLDRSRAGMRTRLPPERRPAHFNAPLELLHLSLIHI